MSCSDGCMAQSCGGGGGSETGAASGTGFLTYLPSSVYGGNPVLSKVNTSPPPRRRNWNNKKIAMHAAMPRGLIFRRIMIERIEGVEGSPQIQECLSHREVLGVVPRLLRF